MLPNTITKPKAVNYVEVPPKMWKKLRKLFPPASQKRKRGRPRADNRAVLNGIWYVLWTGCQWKAVPKSLFGVCSSTLHNRFQEWQRMGLFAQRSCGLWRSSMPASATSYGTGSRLTASPVRPPWVGHKQGKTRQIVAKRAVKSTCWLMNEVHPWRYTLPGRMNTINGRQMICWPLLSFLALLRQSASSIFVPIEVTTMTMCING